MNPTLVDPLAGQRDTSGRPLGDRSGSQQAWGEVPGALDGRYAPRQQPEPYNEPRGTVPPDYPPQRGAGYVPPPEVGRPQQLQRPGRTFSAAPPAAPPPAPPPLRKRKSRWRWVRRLLALLLVIVLICAGVLVYFDTKLHRIDALGGYAGRPADTPGTNWLLVGSDGRAGVEGNRTDTIMIAHLGSGKPLLISIPRDLNVTIPGYGDHKINAAFAFGGAKLLTQTVEQATGIRIDHYAEIGFGGFGDIVDSVGGIKMCLERPIRDPAAGINLKKGCQTLNGKQALGFVRTRHTFAQQDLTRVANQRAFLTALMKKATSITTLLNPFRLWPTVSGVVDSLTVDKATHIWHLAWLAWRIRSATTTTVPTDGSFVGADGDTLAWGNDTTEFFRLIAADKSIPKNLINGESVVR